MLLTVLVGILLLPAQALAGRFTPLHPAFRAHPSAQAKHHRRAAKLPTITRIAPKRLGIGQTLRLRGHNFVPGRKANSVVFRHSRGRNVFVKARLATTRHMWITIPATLRGYLAARSGNSVATRFRLRVLGRRFGARFTPRRLSPVITPRRRHRRDGPTPAPVCQATGAGLATGGDYDADGLTNGQEVVLHTDPCIRDTDGDTLSDFWEYEAGLDYNATARPYPGKRPYPNPLDPSDAGIDHDGDGLTAFEEYQVWDKFGSANAATPLFLSDGTQSSGHPVLVAVGDPLDVNDSEVLTDDERDSDRGDPAGRNGDGLGNWDELHGRMNPAWWAFIHDEELSYGLSEYAQTGYLDPDTDGDGLLDGGDDVDHDGYTNKFEMSREVYWNQPFNPCLPARWAAPVHTCSLHVPVPEELRWPPFDHEIALDSVTPFSMTDSGIEPAPIDNSVGFLP